MNTQEAAILLPLHRPGRPTDGRLQKALRLAEVDSELAPLLAAQTQFDTQMGAAIHSIVPPPNLGQKLRDASARSEKPAPAGGMPIFNPVVLTALVGVLLIVGFVAWTVMERLERFPGREAAERMLGATNKMSGVELDPVAAPAGGMQDWFYMRGFEGFQLPDDLKGLPAVGSRIFRIDGHPIAQIAVDRNNSLLYVFRATDFGVELPESQPWRIIRHADWTAALQRRGELCAMIAFKGSKAEMQSFLASLKSP